MSLTLSINFEKWSFWKKSFPHVHLLLPKVAPWFVDSKFAAIFKALKTASLQVLLYLVQDFQKLFLVGKVSNL